MPAADHPGAGRTRLREHARERDTGRRAEPDHRTTEPDSVGQEAPVVAALVQRKRRQRDVVENRRDEAEAERNGPRCRRQTVDRHHRGAQHEREQEHAAACGAGQQAPVGRADPAGQHDREPCGERDHRRALQQFGMAQVEVHVRADRREQDRRDDDEPPSVHRDACRAATPPECRR